MRFYHFILLCLFSLYSCQFPIPAMVFVGGEDSGHVDGLLIQDGFSSIIDMVLDSEDNLLVLDSSSIRKITPVGDVDTIISTQQWQEDSKTKNFKSGWVSIASIAVDSKDNIFITYTTCIRKLEKQGEEYTARTFVGTCYDQRSNAEVGIEKSHEYDGYNAELITAPDLGFLGGLAIDQQDNIYVMGAVMLRISPDKQVTVLKDENGKPLSSWLTHMLVGPDNQLYVQPGSRYEYAGFISVITNNRGAYAFQRHIPKVSENDAYNAQINYFRSFVFNSQGYLYLLGSNRRPDVYMSGHDDPPYEATLQRIAPNQIRVWSWPLPPDVALENAVLDEKRRVIYTSSPRRNQIYKIPLPDGA